MLRLEGIWHVATPPITLDVGEFPTDFTICPTGQIWVAFTKTVRELHNGWEYGFSQGTRILTRQGSTWKEFSEGEGPSPLRTGLVDGMTCAASGELWYHGYEGFFCAYDGQNAKIYRNDEHGLPIYGYPPQFLSDKQGNIWLARVVQESTA